MRSLLLSLVVFVVGAGAALFAATRAPQPSSAEEQVVLDGAAPSKVVLTSPDGVSVFEASGDGDERAWSATVTRAVVEKPARRGDAGVSTDGGVDVDGPKTERTFRFPVSATVEKSLAKLAPLTARRVLKGVPSERLKGMGLDGPTASLVVTMDGRETRFDVGSETFGGQARYLRAASGDVLLVDGAVTSGLFGTETKLAERRLAPIGVEEVVRLTVAVDDTERAFVHVERESSKARHFVREDAPETRVDEADGVLSALRKLRAVEYVDAAPTGPPVARFRVERAKGAPVVLGVHAPTDGRALVEVGAWRALIPEAQARTLLDDARAAL